MGESPSREAFAQEVHDALLHLYDPAYLQSHPLVRFVHSDPNARAATVGRALREAFLDAIESLRPGPVASPNSHALRRYQALKLRFVEGLEIPQVLDKLSVSRSVYFVEQQKAIEALTSLLFEAWAGGEPATRTSRNESQLSSTETERGRRERPSQPRAQGNLPLQLTSFVGREREIAEVERLLGTTRLLTLIGTGGCGKTRLAYQVAADLLAVYPDGVWVAELAVLSDPELVPQAMAQALGLREQPGVPILETVQTYLKLKRLLLVLDNCEHLLDACAQMVEGLLLACPHLRILATSREILAAAGEVAWRVPSLATPDPKHPPSAEKLAEYEGVRLFVERAQAAQPTLQTTERNAAAIAEVVARLDGIPLAIELAAARTRGLSVEQVAARLGDRFGLLTGGRRTALRRQQTLRATIDWSYDLLSEPERLLLRRLAVFQGGWSLEAAETVCQGDGIEGTKIGPTDVLDLLLRLVDRSLVTPEEAMGEARYRFLETIRQYAQEKLQDSGEVALVRDRHKNWCSEFTRGAAAEMRGPRYLAWLDRLEAEHDNLRAALSWCLERDGEAGLEMVGNLLWFWDYHCHFQEGRRWATEMLSRSGESSLSRAKALRTAGMMARGENDWIGGRELLEESLRLSRESSDRHEITMVGSLLGGTLWMEGRNDEAAVLLREMLTLAREVGDGAILSDILWILSFEPWVQGDLRQARALLEESLAIARRVGHLHGVAYRLLDLAQMDIVAGQTTRARKLLEDSEALFRAERHIWGVVDVQALLGYLSVSDGDLPEAKRRLKVGLDLDELFRGEGTLHCLWLAGEIAAVSESLDRAVRLISRVKAETEKRVSEIVLVCQEALDRTLKVCRAALGEEAFSRAWAEGQAMTLEQAVEYALRDDEA